MPSPAFIVEGHMEQLVVQRICRGVPVQRLEVNSDETEIRAIADRIETIFRILNNRYYPICVIFDREGRAANCGQIISELQIELASRGLDINQFRIGVCDRMIENWILADQELLLRRYRYSGNVVFEGIKGKSTLKGICSAVETYRETTVGARLLIEINVAAVYARSPSFRSFADQIDFECEWLQNIWASS